MTRHAAVAPSSTTNAASVRADAAAAVALAVALAALAFTTGDGTSLAAQTWTEIVLLTAGVFAAGALVVRGVADDPRARMRQGLLPVALFGLLTTLTGCSIAWSVVPDQSWLEAARTLSYLAVFGLGLVLARLAPGRWRVLIDAIALLACALSAWAVLVKALNLNLDGQPSYGRLLAPFGYWNATGLMAALGLPPVLWEASRRHGNRELRAAAVTGIPLLLSVAILSASRTALAAAVCGLTVVLLGSRNRLRSLALLAVGIVSAAAICAWALPDRGITNDKIAAATRVSSGHSFGIVVLVVLAGTFALSRIMVAKLDTEGIPDRVRRRLIRALVWAFAAVPLAGVVALAVSSRGLPGEVSHLWDTLTSTTGRIGESPGRLAELTSSRPRYWHQALAVGEHHMMLGAGAGGFGTARTRYAAALLTGTHVVQHAHSYLLQTFADLGLLGLLLSLVLLVSWAASSSRALSWRGVGVQNHCELGAMYALLGVVIAFGISSAVDWTWFFAGVAVPALICAGWLAGRGSLVHSVQVAPTQTSTNPRGLGNRPLSILGLTGVAIATVAAAWAIWQPLRSADADNAALSALTHRDFAQALADARAATDALPLALEPLQELAAIDLALDRPRLAEAELFRATVVQPGNPEAWTLLAQYALSAHETRLALHAYRRAAQLDLTDPSLPATIARIRAEISKTTRP